MLLGYLCTGVLYVILFMAYYVRSFVVLCDGRIVMFSQIIIQLSMKYTFVIIVRL